MHARRRALLPTLAVLALTASTAAAGPKHKRPAPPKPDLAATVAAGDNVAICKAAIAAAQAGDHARASLVIAACDAAVTTAPDLAASARAARIAIARAAAGQGWSPVEIMVRPAGSAASISIDAFPGLPVSEGRHLLPAGHYKVVAHAPRGDVAYDLALDADSRALVLLDVPAAPAAGQAGVLDFTDGEPTAPVAGSPPKINHGSLLPERYRRALGKPTKVAPADDTTLAPRYKRRMADTDDTKVAALTQRLQDAERRAEAAEARLAEMSRKLDEVIARLPGAQPAAAPAQAAQPPTHRDAESELPGTAPAAPAQAAADEDRAPEQEPAPEPPAQPEIDPAILAQRRALAKRGFRRDDSYYHDCAKCGVHAAESWTLFGRPGGRDIMLCLACGFAQSWRVRPQAQREADPTFDISTFLKL